MTTHVSRPVRHRFTVDDFHRMAATGIISADARVELLDGEVVEMPPIGPLHQGKVDRCTRLLVRLLGDAVIVRVQGPVQLGQHGEPIPDLAVLRPSDDFYESRLPRAEDVVLIIEIGDSTAQRDRRHRVPLYGGHGIPELWLVDLPHQTMTLCREPYADGYRSMTLLRRGDRCAPLAFPDRVIAVTDILG